MGALNLIGAIVREVILPPELTRIPEPDLIMDDPENAECFFHSGSPQGPIAPVYLFVVSHVSQVIRDCKEVLDLGCGSGRLLAQIAKAHPSIEFTGVDLSQSMLDLAGKHLEQSGIKNVNLKTQDMTLLNEFENSSFDAVISSLALHHLPNEEAVETCFRAIRRVLKPSGKILLFDYCLPKRSKTLNYLLSRSGDELPEIYLQDTMNSMKAAFPFSFLKNLAPQFFPQDVRAVTTSFCSFMAMIKSPSQDLSCEQRREFEQVLKGLDNNSRTNYKDLTRMFALKGLKSPIR